MGALRTHWELFVDEAGDFDAADDAVVTAGLLLRSELPGRNRAALRHALWRVAPDFPWPLHANRLRFPVLLGLVVIARRNPVGATVIVDRPERDARLDQLAAQAVERLRALDGKRLEAALGRLRGGEMPSWSDLRSLDATLRAQDPILHRRLEACLRRVHVALRDLLATLQTPAAAGADPLPSALVVACGEYRDGDGIPADAGADPRGSRRFDTLLAGLLERVRDTLIHAGGRHQVWLDVLSRPYVDPFLGARVRAQFHERHLGTIVSRLGANRESDPVRLVPRQVAFYDGGVDPLLVLADFVANRARFVLRPLDRDLASAERGLGEKLTARVRAGLPPLPTLAAVAGSDSDDDSRRWAREQADEWAQASRAGRAG
jgi:hypothetical protein